MSCPDCQTQGSRKALWIALLAVIAVSAIGLAELVGNDGRGGAHERRGHEPGPHPAQTTQTAQTSRS